MTKDNKKSHKKWLPLEANPDVMTEYIMKLGGPPVQCVDVLTTEDWALDMVRGKGITPRGAACVSRHGGFCAGAEACVWVDSAVPYQRHCNQPTQGKTTRQCVCVLVPHQTEKHREEEAARVKASGQTVSPKVYFTKQVGPTSE